MKIKMKKSFLAALDSVRNTHLKEGHEYDVPKHLAEVYIKDGRAVEVSGQGKAQLSPGEEEEGAGEEKKNDPPKGGAQGKGNGKRG